MSSNTLLEETTAICGGLFCWSFMPSCAATVFLNTPAYQKRSGSTNAAHSGTLRHHQVHSGTLRYSLKRSTSILVQPSTSVSSATTVAIATTASRATDTLHCFNGLQQSQRPSRPQTPEEPQRPQGWMPSFDFRLPIPQLSEKNAN